jgi:glycerol-3-phosphate dehydrogenase (NAD(P)+)
VRIAILGAGAWGCALGCLLVETGHDVSLWEFDATAAARLAGARWHDYLGVRLPDVLALTSDMASALRARELVIITTPSEFLRPTLRSAAPMLPDAAPLVCATKGLEADSQMTTDRVIADVLPGRPFALLSGPTFAKEIASGLPAAVVAASGDAFVAQLVQKGLASQRLRVYTSDDVVGVALAGALKNVVALAVGVSDGLGLGGNARAAMITRGLSEMGRLASRLGAHPLTMAGLAGLGDLVLTCTGDLSRNRQVGLALGRGENLADVLARLGQVAEGVATAGIAAALSANLAVPMPITTNVAAVLYGTKSPGEAMMEILARDARAERD